MAGDVSQSGSIFHAWGAGASGTEFTNEVAHTTTQLLSVYDIMERLGHAERHIDILKIDCEGCEYKALAAVWPLVRAGTVSIGRIQVELHGTDFVKIREFFEGAEGAGYILFHKERNHWGCAGYTCVEYALMHMREARSVFENAYCGAKRFSSARQRPAPRQKCAAAGGDWVTRRDVEFYKLSSQSWQDGYLAYVFQNIGVANKYYDEFGFNSDDFNGGSGANTYSLHKNFGWMGLLLDGGHENAAINLHKEFVRADNIVSLFEKYGVPDEPDYVSIDVDSADVLILESLLASRFSPRVLTVEYNANFPLDATLSVTPTTQWTKTPCGDTVCGDTVYGASLGAIRKVAARHGYELVAVVPHLDAVLVRGDLLCGAKPPPLSFWESAINMAGHNPPVDVRQAADKCMDSEVYYGRLE